MSFWRESDCPDCTGADDECATCHGSGIVLIPLGPYDPDFYDDTLPEETTDDE